MAIKDVIGLVNQVSIRVIISVWHSFGNEQCRFCECVALFTDQFAEGLNICKKQSVLLFLFISDCYTG